MQKYKKLQKGKSSKTCDFRRFQPKRTSPLNSAYFFAYCSTGQNWFSTFFRKWHFLDIKIIKNYMFWMFWRLGTMLKRFVIAKSFRLHISKPKKIPGNIFLTFRRSESRPAGAFLHKLRIQGRMHFFEKKSQKALNNVLIS